MNSRNEILILSWSYTNARVELEVRSGLDRIMDLYENMAPGFNPYSGTKNRMMDVFHLRPRNEVTLIIFFFLDVCRC